MYTFLFDILSDTGHVRITLMLASLLHEKGHEVYYTDTSDSVFTSGLLEKGIGRVLYPGDFRWFTPDMVLLDYELQKKVAFYQARNIKYVFITMQLLNCVSETRDGASIIYLPPSNDMPSDLYSQNKKLASWLSDVKRDEENVVIIGLLEEGGCVSNLRKLYHIIKESCVMNPKYQMILLTNSNEIVEDIFMSPPNMTIVRSMNLPEVLPMCDIALIAGNLNTMIEGINANVPALVYSNYGKMRSSMHIRQCVKLGLGLYEDVTNITLEDFQTQLTKILQDKNRMRETLKVMGDYYKTENEQLELLVDDLSKFLCEDKL